MGYPSGFYVGATDCPLNDLGTERDVFACGLGAIEIMGPVVRFCFYAEQTTMGARERVVVAKIVMPLSAVPDGVHQTLAALSRVGLPVPT